MTYIPYFLTSLIYIFSFPNFNISILAWVSIVPFIVGIDNENNIFDVIKKSFLSGLIVFLGSMYWLTKVTIPGYLILSVVLAIFFIFFGVVRYYNKNNFLIPFAWTTIEFLRSNFAGGMPWLLLGASQYKYLPLIQIANITGVYGVSFFVASGNAVFLTLLKHNTVKKKISSILLLFVLFAVLIGYGIHVLNKQSLAEKIKIGVVQPNISQDVKWDPEYTNWMLNKLETLSSSMGYADLIIWPETALPMLAESKTLSNEISLFAKKINSNIIIGSQGVSNGLKRKYFNSAFLILKEGEFAGEYRKIHLVPFGEYVPFGNKIPLFKKFTPIQEEFTKGEHYTVFTCPMTHGACRVSVLICFEDIFPGIARNFVKQGADILINITNDGWYDKTNAVFQHAYLSIFRAVENGVPLVRAANTGLSCFIGSSGKISEVEPFIETSDAREILVTKHDTFYTKWGDLFGWVCVIIMCMIMYINRKGE